jgi:methylphosphotriester-DNA--protein-cysteine methyltransferase
VVLESLDQEQNAEGVASHSYRSRSAFYRLFRAMIEETPVAMRRRLLLERAAWQLSRTQLSVTEIVITFNAHRRMLAMDALRGLGVKVEGFGCPSEYVASLAKT